VVILYTLGKGVASALDRYGKDFSPTKLSMFFVPMTWYYVTWNAFCRIAHNKAPRTYDCRRYYRGIGKLDCVAKRLIWEMSN